MQSPRFNVHVAAGLAAFGFTAIRLLAAPLTLASAEQAVIEALITQDRDTRWDEKHIIADTTQAPFTYLKYEDFVEDLRRTAARRDQPFREALEDFITKNKTSVQTGPIRWKTLVFHFGSRRDFVVHLEMRFRMFT